MPAPAVGLKKRFAWLPLFAPDSELGPKNKCVQSLRRLLLIIDMQWQTNQTIYHIQSKRH